MEAFRPSIIAVDYETALTSGEPSTEYYREDFRVTSCAFAWRTSTGEIKTRYTVGEVETGRMLERIAREKIPVLVFNYQFEFGVTCYRFPEIKLNIQYDTMRLAQVADNGGKLAHYGVKLQTYDDLLDTVEGESDKTEYMTGLSLVACASRFLPPEWHAHKEPYHKWLRENAGAKKGQEGRYLTKLPADMLEAYNVADATVTLLLFETLQAKFAEEGYSPDTDHVLYSSSARFISKARGIGALVDRDDLSLYVQDIEREVAGIEAEFREHFAEQIERIEARSREAWANGLKTQKGRDKRRAKLEEDPTLCRFNVGSGKQLKHLFVDVLGQTPKFWTKAPKAKPGKERKKPFVPQPSFKSAHLHTYGKGGEILKARRKRLLVLKQAQALLKLSARDGKWHFDIKACGTATGRFSGGAQV